MVGGLLLHSQRNLVTHPCQERFDKFDTLCTEQPVVYDERTAVTVSTTSGGLMPYGVDAVFLVDSSLYDSTLLEGEPEIVC